MHPEYWWTCCHDLSMTFSALCRWMWLLHCMPPSVDKCALCGPGSLRERRYSVPQLHASTLDSCFIDFYWVELFFNMLSVSCQSRYGWNRVDAPEPERVHPGGHSRDGDVKPAMGVEKNDGVAWDGGAMTCVHFAIQKCEMVGNVWLVSNSTRWNSWLVALNNLSIPKII